MIRSRYGNFCVTFANDHRGALFRQKAGYGGCRGAATAILVPVTKDRHVRQSELPRMCATINGIAAGRPKKKDMKKIVDLPG